MICVDFCRKKWYDNLLKTSRKRVDENDKNRYIFRLFRRRKNDADQKTDRAGLCRRKMVLIENEFGEIGIDGGF